MTDSLSEKMKGFGGEFAFGLLLQYAKPKIISGLREGLEGYTPEKIRRMVNLGKFPELENVNFAYLTDYVEHIETMSVEELFKDILIPARPDLAEALLDIPNSKGLRWFEKLRFHLLEKIQIGVKTEISTPKEDIVMANCDACGKSWPVARAEFESIKECPFCGSGKDKATPESPIDKKLGQA